MATGQDLQVVDGSATRALGPTRESWGGAAARGLEARQEREAIVAQVLKTGADFGIIPGTPKPTLLKPGAEKIADSLNLYPDYDLISKVEDWDRPLFSYQYRCVLRARGAESIVATGIGSCNSMESRYRWRNASRLCPTCGRDTIIKGKAEYGGGWICFKKKGGCGASFLDDDGRITGQETGKVENDDVYSLVNTIDKMAQKRALVAATLNLGFSEQFTQDLEDGVTTGDEGEGMPASSGGNGGAAKPAVAQPQRASETKSKAAATPAPAAAAPQGQTPPPAAATKGTWSGAVKDVTSRSGQKNGRPWVLYAIECDGEKFQTFDAGLADVANSFKGTGESVDIDWEDTGRGKKALGISASDPGPEA